jgi:transcriptional regulator of acetoin/glycerol metabolism
LNDGIVDEEAYNRRKYNHLLRQGQDKSAPSIVKGSRDKLMYKLLTKYEWTTDQLAELAEISKSEVYRVLRKQKNIELNKAK